MTHGQLRTLKSTKQSTLSGWSIAESLVKILHHFVQELPLFQKLVDATFIPFVEVHERFKRMKKNIHVDQCALAQLANLGMVSVLGAIGL